MGMDKLLTADDVAEVLQVSRRTAYKIMHEMQHMESPFRVAESALRSWIWDKTKLPGEKGGKKKRAAFRAAATGADWHIPRRRE